jgi:SIR2-like domain
MKLMGEENPEFGKLLELGMTERLVIFVGAGPSIEAGLPNWDELALRYVKEALKGDDVPSDLSQRFVNPRHLAVIADATVGEFKRFSILTSALYPDRTPPQPGPTAKEIAKLYRARLEAGLKTYIVTTNFDPLLEMALDLHIHSRMPEQVGTARSFGLFDAFPGYSEGDSLDPGSGGLFKLFDAENGLHHPTVLHLHGGVDLREQGHPKEIAPIILTERDYAMHEYAAQLALLELLDGLDCMMIGLSLQDNDVLSALYTMMKGKETMVVPQPPRGSRYFVAFNEIVHFRKDDSGDQEQNTEAFRRLELQRLQRAGVTPLNQLKSFAQIPQVLHEMALAVELANAGQNEGLSSTEYTQSASHYERRLTLWKEDFDKRYVKPSISDQAQRWASGKCGVALDAISLMMGSTDIADEAAIHIWARSRIEGLWMLPFFCNEFARRGEIPRSLDRRVRHLTHDIALRQAFEGVPTRGFRPAAEHSRWRQIMGVPIVSPTVDAEHPYGRLLVGVVTLSTNLTERDSDLSRCFKDDRALPGLVEARLQELGVNLLVNAPAGLPSADRAMRRIPLKQSASNRAVDGIGP